MGDNSSWKVYILECNDGSYYVGITNDIKQRMLSHASGKGSRYVRSRGFRKLLFTNVCENKSDALKKEYMIKRLSRNKKIDWFRK